MRRCLLSAVVLALACSTFAAPLAAQFIIDHETSGKQLRGLHGPGANAIKRSFEADRDALSTFREILSATGIPGMADRIQVRASAETANAEAQIGADGQRYIFYNSTFMRELSARTRQYWSLVFVIAHEVGHHIAGHLDFAGDNHRVELEADRYAGFILGRMGASHEEAVAAVGSIGSGSATATHPPRDQRVQIVSLGWNDGAGPVRPRSDAPPRVADLPPPQTSSPAQRSTAPQRLVATEQPPVVVPPPESAPRTSSPSVSYAFRVNTRLHGNVLKSGSQADADACRTWCSTTIGCIGYQYGKETAEMKEAVCELYSQVMKRSADANWGAGVVSELALSLPVAYDVPAIPGSKEKQPATRGAAPAAPKSVEAPFRFGYKTRTNSGVVGQELKESTVDQPLNCLLVCMNAALCNAATFTSGAAGKGQCKTFSDVKQILSDQPGGAMAIHKQ